MVPPASVVVAVGPSLAAGVRRWAELGPSLAAGVRRWAELGPSLAAGVRRWAELGPSLAAGVRRWAELANRAAPKWQQPAAHRMQPGCFGVIWAWAVALAWQQMKAARAVL
jgi:hypothetical protein